MESRGPYTLLEWPVLRQSHPLGSLPPALQKANCPYSFPVSSIFLPHLCRSPVDLMDFITAFVAKESSGELLSWGFFSSFHEIPTPFLLLTYIQSASFACVRSLK